MCRSLILVHLALELVYLAHQVGDLELEATHFASLAIAPEREIAQEHRAEDAERAADEHE